VPVSSRGLVLIAISGAAIVLTSCSSSGGLAVGSTTSASASTSASAAAPESSPAAAGTSAPASGASSGPAGGNAQPASGAVPAGYKRVGGSAQGISLAIPAAWGDADLAKESVSTAANKLKVPGVTADALVKDMAQLEKVHAIFALDGEYARTSKGHFARNLNAYCMASGVSETGGAAVADIKASAKSELASVATDITQQDVQVGNVPGVETSYQLRSGTLGTLYGAQLEVLPKPGRACFVTLTAITPQPDSPILAVAAQTARFS
jgi:hypothetical protein